MAVAAPAMARAGDDGARATPYAWYVATIFMVANMVAFIDRAILSLLMEPIKADLGASDAAMGLLHGFAFAILYSALGIPIARLADRSNRRNIILIGVMVWTVMTLACALARSYAMLFIARVGVGAGEATLAPASFSMLADYFPARQLAVALGLVAAGIYLGNGFAILGGGFLLQHFTDVGGADWPILGTLSPWQASFVVVAVLGMPLIALIASVREPQRTATQPSGGSVPFSEIGTYIRYNFRCHGSIILAFSLMIMLGYGSSAWWPAVFQRSFGWSFEQIGLRFGTITLVFGTAGAICGGWLASVLRQRGYQDANVRAALLGAAVLLPATIIAPLMPTGSAALAMLAVINLTAAIPFGGGYAAIQEATPAPFRAQMTAIFLLAINLIGVGLGPVLIGLATDIVFSDAADLRYAMALAAVVISPIAVATLVWGMPAYVGAVRAAEQFSIGTGPTAHGRSGPLPGHRLAGCPPVHGQED